jgi:hypothetical protein
MPGKFLDFYQPFGAGITNSDQAANILAKTRQRVAMGASGGAVLYSANYRQTQSIRRTYDSGGCRTDIAGANQAEVMMALEDLLDADYGDLRGKMRIAPITTMSYVGDPRQIVEDDLRQIEQLLQDGWDVLGWQNQHTRGSDAPYAIGGGIAAVPPDLKELIQGTLKRLRQEYGE